MYYCHAAIFVVASWTSFLIPPKVIPGRMGVLITLLLVLTNLFVTVVDSQPPSQNMTAVGLWCFSCAFFICGALGAYAFLLYKLYRQALFLDEIGLDNGHPYEKNTEKRDSENEQHCL